MGRGQRGGVRGDINANNIFSFESITIHFFYKYHHSKLKIITGKRWGGGGEQGIWETVLFAQFSVNLKLS